MKKIFKLFIVRSNRYII